MIKKITLPIYHGDLVIIQEKNLEDIPKKWKPKGFSLHGYEAYVAHKDTKTGYRRYIMAFTNPTTEKVIVHETVHCVSEIFDHLGIKYDVLNDEPAAYLTEWIFDQCCKYLEINKQTKHGKA